MKVFHFRVPRVVVAVLALVALAGWALHSGAYIPSPAASAAVAPDAVRAVDDSTRAEISQAYAKLPLSFVATVGSQNSPQQFLTTGSGYSLLLTRDAALLRLHAAKAAGRKGKSAPAAGATSVIAMRLAGANPSATARGEQLLPGKVNFVHGRDPSKWRTHLPTYAKVKYQAVYPGVDLVYYGNQGKLEYDFIVAPGSDPRRIGLEMRSLAGDNQSGNARVTIGRDGDLLTAGATGEVRLHKPVAYQFDAEGKRSPVEARFILRRAGLAVGFELGSYDHARELVIDPVLSYSTYLGGSSEELDDNFGSVVVDSSGSAYIAAETDSTDFPVTPGAFQTSHGAFTIGDSDGTVTKLSPDGSSLIYSTYLGGDSEDYANKIAVNSAGEAYVVGETSSADFPVTAGAFQTAYAGGTDVFTGDAFVTKLSSDGSSLTYSTYLGGSGGEIAFGLRVNSSGNAYVGGYTSSTDFPVTAGAFQTALAGIGALGYGDAFVTKLNTTGSGLVYSTYLGGTGDDAAFSIALDSTGKVYATGLTNSADFPVTAGAFQTTFGGSGQFGVGDAFVTKLNASGSALVYSTFVGGSDDDNALDIALDKQKNAYVVGNTASLNYPVTPGAFQTSFAGSGSQLFGDGFVTKLNASGSALSYSTYLGGTSDDALQSIVVDQQNRAGVAGYTTSSDFPVTPGAFQKTYSGGTFYGDALITVLNPSGSGLRYSSYFGGTDDDGASALALGSPSSAYVMGFTASTDFPVTAGAFQTSLNVAFDITASKFNSSATSRMFGGKDQRVLRCPARSGQVAAGNPRLHWARGRLSRN